MRKFIILLLITVLFILSIPSFAAENEGIYELTIYPNGRGLLRGTSDDLVIGGVGVTYSVDNESNEIDIYFDESIFIDDVVSEGNTVHNSIKFNNDNEIEVNEPLKTEGFMCANVNAIIIKYDDISKVDSITLFADRTLADDWIGILDDNDNILITEKITRKSYDNNLDTYDKSNSISPGNYWFEGNLYFSKPFDITGFRLKGMSFAGNGARILFYNKSNVQIGIVDNSFYGYDATGNLVNCDFKGVNRVYISSQSKSSSLKSYIRLYEIEFFGVESGEYIPEPEPLEEVSSLDYTLQGNNVTLSWTNPRNDRFEGVKIYRDGEYIETTTEESFTESLPIGTYQYRITTLEDGEESEGITIDVSVQTIPTPVKGVNIINKSSSSGSITWEPNPKAQNISKYIIYVNGEKHGEIENPPYQLDDLEIGKKYDIAVSAVNSMGEGDKSDLVSYTPSRIEDLKGTIKIGEILSYISMLFTSVWPLLALTMAIILSPYITDVIKSVVRSRRNA